MKTFKTFILLVLVVINLQTLSFIGIPTVQARQSEGVGFCARVELAANDGITNLKKGRRQFKTRDDLGLCHAA